MSDTKRTTIVAVGDANADLTLDVGAWPKPGREGQVDGAQWGSGGSALNVACMLASLGVDARLVACVGGDELAPIALAEARRRGVSLSFVQRHPAAPTGLCVVGVDDRGERTFLSHRGANSELGPVAPLGALDDASLLHVSAYALLRSPQADTASDLVLHATRSGVPVSLDLGGPPACLCRARIAQLAPCLWALFGNEAEIASLQPNKSESHIVADLLSGGTGLVVIKRGASGCSIVRRGDCHDAPARRVVARDTTACGDAFVAGCVVALLGGASIRDAARFANWLGATTATRRGAAQSLPSAPEIAAHAPRRALSVLPRHVRELSRVATGGSPGAAVRARSSRPVRAKSTPIGRRRSSG